MYLKKYIKRTIHDILFATAQYYTLIDTLRFLIKSSLFFGSLFGYRQNYFRAVMINIYRLLYKIGILSVVNIYKLLWVSVCQRKPAALYLYHYFMSLFKSVSHIRQRIFYLGYFTRHKSFGGRKTVAVSATHNLGAYQHLVTSHWVFSKRICNRSIRIYIYQLYHKICIGIGQTNHQIGHYRARQSNILCQSIGVKYQYICTSGRKALIVGHIFAGAVIMHFFGIWYRFSRVADVAIKCRFSGFGSGER